MNTIQRWVPFFAVPLCFALNTRAQERPSLLIGVTGGYELIAYNTDMFPILNLEPTAYTVQNGKGSGYYYGVSLEHSFIFDRRLYYLFDFGFESMPATFSGNLTNGDNSASLWTVLSYYYLSWGIKYDFSSDSLPRGFGVQACLSIGFKNEANYWKSVTVNNETAIDVSSDPTATSLRIAVRSELTYDWPLNDFLVMTPSIGYDLPIMKVDPNNNWRASAFYGGVALRYAVW